MSEPRLHPPTGQHRLGLRGIVLNPIDRLPRNPRRLRDGGRAGVLSEQVPDDPELRAVEAEVCASNISTAMREAVHMPWPPGATRISAARS
jgi:hypothetical protein